MFTCLNLLVSLSFIKMLNTQIHSGYAVCRKFLLVRIESSDLVLLLDSVVERSCVCAGVEQSLTVPPPAGVNLDTTSAGVASILACSNLVNDFTMFNICLNNVTRVINGLVE